MERVLVLDLFGVFLRFCHLSHDESVLAKCSAPRAKVREFFSGPAWYGYECGRLDDAGFTRALHEELGYRGSIEDFGERFFRSVSIDRDFYDFFQEIRHKELGWDKWLLTNICPVFYRNSRRRYPGIFSSFDTQLLSFEMGCRKPEPEIFRKVIGKGQGETNFIFLDDTFENVQSAEREGLRSVLFRPESFRNGTLRTVFRKYGMGNI